MAALLRFLAGVLVIAGTYYVAARFGLWLAAIAYKNVTTIWPATGIAIAVLLLGGRRWWPGVALGAFAANAATGLPVVTAGAIAIGNTLEAVCAATLLRSVGFQPALTRVRDVVALVGLAALASTAVSATIGVAALLAGGFIAADELGAAWRTWWLGDMAGALLVLPLACTMTTERPALPQPARLAEGVALVAVLVGVTSVVFSAPRTVDGLDAYLVGPPLIWAALRFGPLGAAGSALLVSVVAIAGTLGGLGPFALTGLNVSLMHLQAFMGLQAVTVLLLAAATVEGRAAEERRQRIAALERLDALKDQFLGVLSHELRTPLNGIIGFASVLEDGLAGPLTPAQRQHVGRVLASADTLLALVDDLLDMSRLRAGRFDLRPEPIDMAALAEAAIQQLGPTAAAKRVELVCRSEPALPSPAADPDCVRQVLLKLVGNAIKFSPEGGTVEISLARDGDAVRCEVADQGVGIAEPDLPRAFSVLEQLDMSATRPVGGAGLGLSLSKAIVEAHDGRIGVESEPGKGTRVWFTLPLTAGPTAAV